MKTLFLLSTALGLFCLNVLGGDVPPDPNIQFDLPGRPFVVRKSLPGDLKMISLYLDKKIKVDLSGDLSEELLLQIERDWKLRKTYNPYMISHFTNELTLKQYNGKRISIIQINDQKPDEFKVHSRFNKISFRVTRLAIEEITRYLQLTRYTGCGVVEQMDHWTSVVKGLMLISAQYRYEGTNRKHVNYHAINHWEQMDFPGLFISEWNGQKWQSRYPEERYTSDTFLTLLREMIISENKT